MRLSVKHNISQVLIFGIVMLAACAAVCSCSAQKEEAPIIPPVTSPFSRDYIGYGVITASYTHVTEEPEEGSVSMGYLRRGSLVRLKQRRTVKTGNSSVSWVLIEEPASGWLKEEVMDVYDNESRAKTAAESIAR